MNDIYSIYTNISDYVTKIRAPILLYYLNFNEFSFERNMQSVDLLFQTYRRMNMIFNKIYRVERVFGKEGFFLNLISISYEVLPA